MSIFITVDDDCREVLIMIQDVMNHIEAAEGVINDTTQSHVERIVLALISQGGAVLTSEHLVKVG